MTTQSVQQPTAIGIGEAPAGQSENPYLDQFSLGLKYMSRMQKVSGHIVGPLEAHTPPEDRLLRRIDQMHALTFFMLHCLDGFDSMNDSLRLDYLSALEDLITAAKIDGALSVTGRGFIEGMR